MLKLNLKPYLSELHGNITVAESNSTITDNRNIENERRNTHTNTVKQEFAKSVLRWELRAMNFNFD